MWLVLVEHYTALQTILQVSKAWQIYSQWWSLHRISLSSGISWNNILVNLNKGTITSLQIPHYPPFSNGISSPVCDFCAILSLFRIKKTWNLLYQFCYEIFFLKSFISVDFLRFLYLSYTMYTCKFCFGFQ